MIELNIDTLQKTFHVANLSLGDTIRNATP
jgi:hypothetical protein